MKKIRMMGWYNGLSNEERTTLGFTGLMMPSDESIARVYAEQHPEEEKYHYFYYMGCSDGVASVVASTPTDFEKRLEEFKKVESETKD